MALRVVADSGKVVRIIVDNVLQCHSNKLKHPCDAHCDRDGDCKVDRRAGRGSSERVVDTRGGGADCLLLVRAGAGSTSPTRCCCCCSLAKRCCYRWWRAAGGGRHLPSTKKLTMQRVRNNFQETPKNNRVQEESWLFHYSIWRRFVRSIVPELCQRLRFMNRNLKPGSPR